MCETYPGFFPNQSVLQAISKPENPTIETKGSSPQIFRGRGLFTRFLVPFVQRFTSVRLDVDFANASVNIREQ